MEKEKIDGSPLEALERIKKAEYRMRSRKQIR